MSIGRTFEESFLKSVRSLEVKVDHLEKKEFYAYSKEELYQKIKDRDDERIFAIAQWLRMGYSMDEIHTLTNIDYFFLKHIQRIIDLEKEMKEHPKGVEVLYQLKEMVSRINISQETGI